VVVDRGVQVVIATAASVGPTVDRPSGPPLDSVAATSRDAAEFLDVEVDQVTGMGCS
jgi:hypothetical protein